MGLRSARQAGLVAVAVTGVLLSVLSAPAGAAPKPVNPTDAQLAAAQARKQQAAQQLGTVSAQLVLLEGQLHRAAAETDAAIASYDATNLALQRAVAGTEGHSTGPHLHLEVRIGGMSGPPVDPQVFLARRGVSI